MISYLVRRMLYAIPILVGVNLFTFLLFFVVNSPDDMARMQLGEKRVTEEAVARWKQERVIWSREPTSLATNFRKRRSACAHGR